MKVFRWSFRPLEALIALALIVAISYGIQLIGPTSGLALVIHQFWHIIALVAQFLANALSAVAQLLNSL